LFSDPDFRQSSDWRVQVDYYFPPSPLENDRRDAGGMTMQVTRNTFGWVLSMLKKIDLDWFSPQSVVAQIALLSCVVAPALGDDSVAKVLVNIESPQFGIASRALVPMGDSGYLVVTGNYSDAEPAFWARVIKVKESGLIEWNREYGKEKLDADLNRGVVLKGGDAILVGSANAQGFGQNEKANAWMICIDSKGRMVWERSIGFGATTRAVDVQGTATGGALVGANVRNAGRDSVILLELSGKGETLWKKPIRRNDGNIVLSRAHTMASGATVVTGATWEEGSPKTKIWVSLITNSGDLLWTKYFEMDKTSLVTPTAITHSGEAIIVSINGTSGSRKSSWLLGLASDGSEQWRRQMDQALLCEVTELMTDRSSDNVLVGSPCPGGGQNIVLAKIQKAGQVTYLGQSGVTDGFALAHAVLGPRKSILAAGEVRRRDGMKSTSQIVEIVY
jgi:hypothetical protein